MPALFGYLCALCLLLGGGYGALSWLAAPEPAHVVTKAKPRPYDAQAEIPKLPANSLKGSTAAVTSSAANDDKVSSSSIDRLPLPEAEPRAAKVDLGTRSKAGGPVPTRQTRYASEVSVDKVKRIGEGASAADGTANKKLDRPRFQRTSHQSERKLVLMTMRTIQFPDGRKVTQLIPYRGRERILKFSANE